jgi:hypothetical protein
MKKIFIGGCDRSGTTYLASLLGNLDSTIVTPESLFKHKILSNEPIILDKLLIDLDNDWRFKIWGIAPEALAIQLAKQELTSELVLETMVKNYSKLVKTAEETCIWVDHSPNNMELATTLNSHLSECYFIHIIRDGRAVANSIMDLEWGPNTSLYSAMYWMKKVGAGLALTLNYPHKLLQIRYEDLIQNEVETLKSIYRFVGETNVTETAKPVTYFLPEFTKKQHSAVGSGPDIAKIDSWKNILSESEIALFEKIAGQMLHNLGYDLISKNKPTLFHVLKELVVEIYYRYLINPRKYRAKRNSNS